jgi:glucose uptake protein GlcU
LTPSTKKYRIGFSRLGFIASLLPLIPNVFWILLPPVSSTLRANDSGHPLIELVGTVSQSLMFAMLILIVNTRPRSMSNTTVPGVVGLICLIGYQASWVSYFTAPITPAHLLMMAVLPSIYFISVGLYLKNYPSLIPAILFGLIHISTTAANYL